ncbi:subtilase-type protease inhibitor [Streptomyces lichenis]|uniref:Subtilase-type protease inhibitor n=1 Tax=Streptomyces lichenis TaxID=2306967 RepID=A0ABT0IFL3_9ACTN|nr:subtilase-type protease inhibitor [Streptomyces lichenis]MCK8680120.1 subtilase-type protease inhibitor [Streptomyces lichenis]
MKSRITAVAGALTLVAITAATAGAAAPEQAPPTRSLHAPTAPEQAPATRSLYAPSALVLTVNDGPSAMAAAPQRAVTLTCAYAPGGTHPRPAAACDALQEADGRLSRLHDTGTSCTLDLRPVTVTLQGVWQGRRVDEARSFSNDCVRGAFGPLTTF